MKHRILSSVRPDKRHFLSKLLSNTPSPYVPPNWRIPLTIALISQLDRADQGGLELVDLELTGSVDTIRYIFVEKPDRRSLWRPPLAYHLYCYKAGNYLMCTKAVHLVFNMGAWTHTIVDDLCMDDIPDNPKMANTIAASLLSRLCADPGRLDFFVGSSSDAEIQVSSEFICTGIVNRDELPNANRWLTVLERSYKESCALMPVSYTAWYLLRRQIPSRSVLSNLYIMTPDDGEAARQFHLPSCYKLTGLADGQQYTARNASAWFRGATTFNPGAYMTKMSCSGRKLAVEGTTQ